MQIELMSPAGNFNSLIEAINNGADSVYLGLKQFNARRPADNFTVYQLKKALKLVKDKNKKIYLTLNIDLKSNELKEAAAILHLLKGLKVNAVIVKDPALIYIINKFYSKELEMHFSTQCSVDSSYGVNFVKSLGAKRIVLARELDIEEISAAGRVDGIETEIFAEGSMCFSISGRCLMSSWVGGRSGNRGACTAPCRVLWNKDDKQALFFSMKDMSLVRYIEEIKKSGVKALKIEGRLKRPSWVGTVTKIYRQALDNPEDKEKLDILYQELSKYSAREVGSGHLVSHAELIGKNEEWNNYSKQGSILFKKENDEKNQITIDAYNNEINIDVKFLSKNENFSVLLPAQPKKAKLIAFDNIESYFNKNLRGEYSIDFKIIGSESFSSSFMQKVVRDVEKVIKKIIDEEEKLPSVDNEITRFITPKSNIKKREKALGDYPDKIVIAPGQIKDFIGTNFNLSCIVVSLENSADIELIRVLKKKYKIILSIPSVLYENDAKQMFFCIRELFELGFTDFEANSYTGMELLKELKCNKSLGTELPVMNHLSAKYYYELGYNSVYAALEAESSVYKALSSFCDGNIECLVFGKVPLFSSRVDSEDFEDGAVFFDKFGVELECHKIRSINRFLSKKPVSLIGNKVKEVNVTFDTLTADLRYFENPVSILNSIFKNVFNEKNSSSFNFFKKLV